LCLGVGMGVETTASQTSQVDELRAKLGKLEVALSAIVDPIVWIDMDGRVQWYNAPFRRLVERQDSEVMGAKLVELLPLAEDGKPLTSEAHPIQVALNGQPNAFGSYEFRKGDQRVILEVFAVRVRFSKHEMSTVVAVHDITERKRAEEKERQLANAAAASAVAARKRAEELGVAYKELQSTQQMLVQAEKMAAVGQLASGIAHEVKNPLGIILQGVNYLEQEIRPAQNDQQDVLQMIKEAVLRSDKIVRDLLNFSRQAPLEAKPRDLNAVLRTALELVGKQLTLSNIKVTERLAAALPVVLIDENQMKQVFINVILNSLQAMPRGGEVILRTRLVDVRRLADEMAARARQLFRPGEAAVLCEVEDTGTGIPKDKLGKVFDPFFTTKPAGQGTGLGLAITRSIVEKHRGVIAIDSEEGRGTTVRVALPVAPSDPERA